MGAETLAIGALVASAVGSAATIGANMHAAKQQKKAARSAANQAAQVADSAIARSADSAAAQQTNTDATTRNSTQNAAKRRMPVYSTVNRVIGDDGGRITLN